MDVDRAAALPPDAISNHTTRTMNTLAERHALTRQSGVIFGIPDASNGAAIHQLVRASKPLDLNSTYAYLLLCAHFSQTCVHAVHDGRSVGFISAYHPPQKPGVLFIWQVAVAAEMRGQGLAKSMLLELLRRETSDDCRYLETTVSPSNQPSLRLFHALARDLNAPVAESVMFSANDFGTEHHEQETLIRIGPMMGKQTARRVEL